MPPIAVRRRGPLAAASALLVVLAATAWPQVGAGQGAPGDPASQRVVGVPATNIQLIGAATGTQETWAVGEVRGAGAVVEGKREPAGGAGGSQLALLRHTSDTGWRVVQGFRNLDGSPNSDAQLATTAGPAPGRVTPSGGVVLLARDADGPTVQIRDPTTDMRRIPRPDSALLPTDQSLFNAVTPVYAAIDEPTGRTGALVVTNTTPAVLDRVLHWDGTTWTQEDVVAPAGATLLAARGMGTGLGGTFLVAQAEGLASRTVLLERRSKAGGGFEWRERALTDAPSPSAIRPREYPADPVTVTESGVWIDVRITEGANEAPATLYFDFSQNRVTGSWCDLTTAGGTALCSRPLGVGLPAAGYRSYAWGGAGFGSRIITAAPLPARGDETIRGAYARFEGTSFRRLLGAGEPNGVRTGGAFLSIDEGWLDGTNDLVHVTRSPTPSQLQRQALPFRRPLLAIAGEPGKPAGSPDARALAVGADGQVARYSPGGEWTPEFLLTGNGSRETVRLRGVAWPEPGRAHAVGDQGQMWMWRAESGLWERDEGAPLDEIRNFMDVEFQSGNAVRGYAAGRNGLMLRYDKSWTPDPLPAEAANADVTQLAFAGGQALAATDGPAASDRHLLVNDGGGWRVDQSAEKLLRSQPDLHVFAVAGLPDGGAVAAGTSVVMIRDSADAEWRFSAQPLPGLAAAAVAAVREGGVVRPVVAAVELTRRNRYPAQPMTPIQDPNAPPNIDAPIVPAGATVLLRETASGWRDEHESFRQPDDPATTFIDAPRRVDSVMALLLDQNGSGWAVGGYTGADEGGDGDPSERAGRRTQTAAVYRYPGSGPPVGAQSVGVDMDPGVARLLIAGHAKCAGACADLANVDIGPDVWTGASIRLADTLYRQPNGPRAFVLTGSRLASGLAGGDRERESRRYAETLGSGGVPVFTTPSDTDTADGSSLFFRASFTAFGAPFGGNGAAPGIVPVGETGAPATGGARTHYAFDTTGPAGTVRVIVIDNSRGSLEASDPHQNPAEPQRPWLSAVLADARARGIPAVVVGSRDLNSAQSPADNAATDADQTARQLLDGGASAYFHDRPEQNRITTIPAGVSGGIPEFSSGTLGYGTQEAVNLFGESGVLLTEVDVARRNAATNRAPVNVRLLPLIEDLTIDARDGLLLRRSRVGLFQALGRRPRAGDRRKQQAAGADPHVTVPAEPCTGSACGSRVEPEYTFTSSDPDLGDFVRQDPTSANPRKVFLDGSGRPVTDNESGLFCAFNAGRLTVTVRTGGLAYAQRVQILNGTAQRPCGTRPLDPSRFTQSAPAPAAPPAAPAAAPASTPASTPPVAPPPLPVVPAAVVPAVKAVVARPTPPAGRLPFIPPLPFLPTLSPVAQPGIRALPPPPTAPVARPTPPGGATVRVYEEKREEEEATEQSSASVRYAPDEHEPLGVYLAGMALLAAVAGAGIARSSRRRGSGGRPVPILLSTPAGQAQRRRAHGIGATTRRR